MISYNSNKSAASGPWTYSSIDRQATLDAATAGATVEVIDMQADSAGTMLQQIKMDVNADEILIQANDFGPTKIANLQILTDTIRATAKDYTSGQNAGFVLDYVNGFFITNEIQTVFKIDHNGSIRTNQIGPPAVKPTNTGWIPIYNETGTLKGYLPLFT